MTVQDPDPYWSEVRRAWGRFYFRSEYPQRAADFVLLVRWLERCAVAVLPVGDEL